MGKLERLKGLSRTAGIRMGGLSLAAVSLTNGLFAGGRIDAEGGVVVDLVTHILLLSLLWRDNDILL